MGASMITTRFNPSTNGGIHIGHVYALLVNEHLAHDNGGKFYIRFDNTSQGVHLDMKHPELAPEIMKHQREDLEWLDIPVDGWQAQSDIQAEAWEMMMPRYAIIKDPHPHYLPVSIRLGNSWEPYPYTPFQTAERVCMDRMLGITHVIRSEEFLTEYALYCYFCDMFSYPRPEFIFLPRLQGKYGNISKTNGGYTISEMRGDGYTVSDIKRMLEWACLIWPNNGWNIYNLRSNPRIDL